MVEFLCLNLQIYDKLTLTPTAQIPSLYTKLRRDHVEHSPSTPYSVVEYQGGSFDAWGGLGFDQCSVLINHEFKRVFYKNIFTSGVTIFNIYMVNLESFG